MRVVLAAVSLAATPALALEITQVQATPTHFDPAKKQSTSVHFTLDADAHVSLHWYDGLDRAVRTQGPKKLSAGEHALTWDGKNDAGASVPPEAYVFTLEAVAADGTRTRHDLTDLSGSEPIEATDVVWDAAAQRIRYRLAQPARVNVRVGLKANGPLLNTIVDWVPREAGVHAEAWDGWDASHVLDLTQHPSLALAVDAYTLSTNTVFVGAPPDHVALPPPTGGQGAARARSTQPRKRMHYHAHQPLDQRGDVAIALTLAQPARDTEEGYAVVSGQVPIRLDVDPTDRQRILATRFEPVFFVDGTFVFENEVGFLPTTWVWDTTRVNDGWHYISANVRGYEGNFGMATLKLKVVNKTSEGTR